MGISCEETLDCFKSDDLIGLGMEADAVRRRLHPEGVVSYTVCGRIDPRTSGESAILAEIGKAASMGASSITLCSERTETIEQMELLLRAIKSHFPSLWLHCFSAGEIQSLAQRSGLTLYDTIARLRDAGLDSIPGDVVSLDDATAGVLGETGSNGWFDVHRTAHRLGLPTTACMVFGQGETLEQRVSYLEALRGLQVQTGGFTAFSLRAFVPRAAGPRVIEEPTAVEYLKMLAISRMVLDNIANIEIDFGAQGLKVFETCLRFGGNDAGSLPIGGSAATAEQLRQVVRDAGFRPVERDLAYRTVFLN
ncbi:cyclic dehypoxanthine futalosine synthase [Edaphobacter acidisoli]|uniref:Cyclic dehypoxanthine futalosine synthase n=1 Tax=Edaphobacter acidisoli TaxID=2040573 RepID=A0A916RF22_9BACT|nr:radical SAM protein [Edaphobacter acidisoli]GGA54088.1 cyclic dehypoxanthine futalosine synthase [Edaphobacter acidisoli]